VEKTVGLVESSLKNGVLSTINKTVQTASTINNDEGHTIIVKLAFRFYDGSQSNVFDQLAYSHTYNWYANTHFQYKHAPNETSFYGGMLYGKRVVPSYLWVNRNYFKKPKNSVMKMSTRMAIAGDWKGASELWHQIEKEGSRKRRGRAAYNLALAYEVMGDLEQAQSWCRKSKEVYRNNLAENYLKILEQRVNEAKVVEGQMQ
jgi:tetratricopeptide (TPR) repeat protein